ncbi:MAG: radical SAM protein [Terriglobales bacterium]
MYSFTYAIPLGSRQELRHVKPGEEIAIGTATDPYQPAEKRFEVTRAILQEFARHSGFEIGIVTKSNLVLRDVDLLQQVSRHNKLFVNLTITTLNPDLARILEPRAPRPDLRLEAMKELNQAGIAAGVICAPVLPGITDSPRDLEALVRATADAGGKYVFANSLFLKPCSAAVFMPFLEKEFPELVESYRQLYKDRAFLSTPYRKRLSQLMARLRQKYGIRTDYDRYSKRTHPVIATQPQEQMNLFSPQQTPAPTSCRPPMPLSPTPNSTTT